MERYFTEKPTQFLLHENISQHILPFSAEKLDEVFVSFQKNWDLISLNWVN